MKIMYRGELTEALARLVDLHCQRTDYYTRGESREALEVAQQCAQAIGVLAASTHRENLLTVGDVQNLVGYDCEVMK